MIKASFEKVDNEFISMRVEGHAGQADKGKDIVCASASILAYTVAQTLTQMHKQGWLKKKPNLTLTEGNSLITCRPKPEYFDECLMVFFVAEVGYHLLATNYPQYVAVELFGEAK